MFLLLLLLSLLLAVLVRFLVSFEEAFVCFFVVCLLGYYLLINFEFSALSFVYQKTLSEA